MGRIKTLHKRKRFSANTSKLRLKKGIKLAKHNPFKALLDEKLIAQAFWECVKENDLEGAMEVISAHFYVLTYIPRPAIQFF